MRCLRVFRCLGLLLGLLLLGSVASAQDPVAPRVDLVFFGTSSCPTCAGWKRFDYPKLKEAPGFQRVHFTEVIKSIQAPIPPASDFPAEIAGYHDAIADRFHGAIGSPMFALLVNGAVVDAWRGTRRSNEQILAEVDKAFASNP